MSTHPNPRIQQMWQHAAATICNLAPQMPPDLVASLAAALTPQVTAAEPQPEREPEQPAPEREPQEPEPQPAKKLDPTTPPKKAK